MAEKRFDPIPEAARLIRDKNFEEAEKLLKDFLYLEPYSEMGWFLYSYAVPQRTKKIQALEKTLSINPDHAEARERLKKFRARVRREQDTEFSDHRTNRIVLFGAIGIALLIILFFFGTGITILLRNILSALPGEPGGSYALLTGTCPFIALSQQTRRPH